jgi:hypothetical protein
MMVYQGVIYRDDPLGVVAHLGVLLMPLQAFLIQLLHIPSHCS